jgi:RNA polymerase sigma factor for flagellar operon FliA
VNQLVEDAEVVRASGSGSGRGIAIDPDPALDAAREKAQRAEEVALLWEQWQSDRSIEIRNKLVEVFYPMAAQVARRMAATLSDEIAREDIEGYAAEGLINAIEHFDPNRGILFSTFAPYRIRGAVFDRIRELDWVSRSDRRRERDLRVSRDEFFHQHRRPPTRDEEAALVGLSLAAHDSLVARLASSKMTSLDVSRRPDGPELDVPDLSGGLLAALLSAERSDMLREALEALNPRERQVIVLMFVEEQSLSQVGKLLGVTESRICQIRARALRTMRRSLVNGGITEAREEMLV